MNRLKRGGAALIFALIFLVAFLGDLDSVIYSVAGFRTRYFNEFVVYFTTYGNWIWGLGELFLLLFFKLRRRSEELSRVLAIAILAWVVSDRCITPLLKEWIGRPRPFQSDPSLEPLGPRPMDPSMPSGHTCSAFALAVPPFYYLLWKGKKAAASLVLLYAGFMGFTRVYCLVHYPSDVLAGAMIGWLTGYALLRILKPVALHRL